MDMRGFVWIGQRFLSHDKWQVKLLSDFSYFTFTNDSNSRNNKFIKEWQVKDKIIESIFPQFAFNHLQMTQTQEIINS